jgi:hypothetical protein
MAKAKQVQTDQQGWPEALQAVISVPGAQAAIGTLLAARKEFKSGKGGWWGQQRFAILGRVFQAQIQVVEISSKKEA